ncbi:MAG: hypothetical protein AB7O49_00650 [Sphingomonadales bacterium]
MQQDILDRIMDEQDKDFVRVLEDLIDVLIAQGVITMDMMPREAAEKLERRRRMRSDSIRHTPDIDMIDSKLAQFEFRN